MSPKSKKFVLAEIRNPLVFFALALLVIEAIMGGVVAATKMTPALVFAAVCVMAVLFLVVVGAIAFITIKWPLHLYEEVQRDLKSARQTKEFLDSAAFRDTVRDIVAEVVKPECLLDSAKDESE
jgi:heme A synthase